MKNNKDLNTTEFRYIKIGSKKETLNGQSVKAGLKTKKTSTETPEPNEDDRTQESKPLMDRSEEDEHAYQELVKMINDFLRTEASP